MTAAPWPDNCKAIRPQPKVFLTYIFANLLGRQLGVGSIAAAALVLLGDGCAAEARRLLAVVRVRLGILQRRRLLEAKGSKS